MSFLENYNVNDHIVKCDGVTIVLEKPKQGWYKSLYLLFFIAMGLVLLILLLFLMWFIATSPSSEFQISNLSPESANILMLLACALGALFCGWFTFVLIRTWAKSTTKIYFNNGKLVVSRMQILTKHFEFQSADIWSKTIFHDGDWGCSLLMGDAKRVIRLVEPSFYDDNKTAADRRGENFVDILRQLITKISNQDAAPIVPGQIPNGEK